MTMCFKGCLSKVHIATHACVPRMRTGTSAPLMVQRSKPRSLRLQAMRPICATGRGDEADDSSERVYAAWGAGALLAEAVVFVSLKSVFENGCGLPPSLGGLTSLVEGVSYLGVVGVLAASAVTKVQTGSGLPTGRDGYELGPGALLGLAEGVAYLYLLAAIVFLAYATANGGLDAVLPEAGELCMVGTDSRAGALNALDPCTYAPQICIR
eukprot:CAMPEP_0118925502 /NCGR_PEP_ID=MMETSP1169-20130426/3383_1 /TAXON_ID=36882 /ORGANISM="Pyramimonas obovata, Strain CCMP722" /LENGTH=210 /DNA_ID=CAMNT_0006866819 /DNA_START=43 /DNA_END=675 /DNA_ORIENTATION=-